MTSFRTELNITPSLFPIHHGHKVVTMGSCFADELGNWLKGNKFNCDVNPFGTTFHPLAIHQHLIDAINTTPPSPDKFICVNDVWSHFDFHSQWSGPDRIHLEQKLFHQINYVNEKLNNADVLIITYGTAWVYENSALNKLVANCHKVPSSAFIKRLLRIDEIVSSFVELYRTLKGFNSKIRVIVTVSPVRHLKDTMELNQVSKSTLLLAKHQILQKHNDVDYFPSYEMVMDDLRDYRYYDEDMIHPNSVATNYIARKFSEKYFQKDTVNLISKWTQLQKALQHRPFHEQSGFHQKFLTETLSKLQDLHQHIDVGTEIEEVKTKIANQ